VCRDRNGPQRFEHGELPARGEGLRSGRSEWLSWREDHLRLLLRDAGGRQRWLPGGRCGGAQLERRLGCELRPERAAGALQVRRYLQQWCDLWWHDLQYRRLWRLPGHNLESSDHEWRQRLHG